MVVTGTDQLITMEVEVEGMDQADMAVVEQEMITEILSIQIQVYALFNTWYRISNIFA